MDWKERSRACALLEMHLGAKPPPCVAIGAWPTPVQRLRRLGDRLGAEVWVKRDDLSGDPLGGNKVRKLEFLLAEAIASGKRSLVTMGGVGSHHVLATAVYGRKLGFRTHVAVFPQPDSPDVRRTAALVRRAGADIHPCHGRAFVPPTVAAILMRAERPYLIGPGGSSPAGALGYVAAALELRDQIDAGDLPAPDAVFVALGSGGTLAGLALGCGLAGLRTRIFGVRVVEWPLIGSAAVRLLVLRTAMLVRGLGGKVPRFLTGAGAFSVVHDQAGQGYGQPTRLAEEAVRIARETEGLVLETTYTAKAMAALIAHCRHERGRVLFWNTFDGRDLI